MQWAATVEDKARPPKRKIRVKTADKSKQKSVTSKKQEKFYVVAVGRVPGVYANMQEVRKQTSGLEGGGKLKAFTSREDAENYVNRHGRATHPSQTTASAASRSLFVVVRGKQ